MNHPDYTHLVGHADTDTLGVVDSLAAIEQRRHQRPVTPPQWRNQMVTPVPGTHPLQRTSDQTAAAERLTVPQAPVPPIPAPPVPIPVYMLDTAASQRLMADVRTIRNLAIWAFIILVVAIVVSIALGTAIANDIQNLQNLTGTLPGQ